MKFDGYPENLKTREEEQRYLNYIKMLGPCAECKRTPLVGGVCQKPGLGDNHKIPVQKVCMDNDFKFMSKNG